MLFYKLFICKKIKMLLKIFYKYSYFFSFTFTITCLTSRAFTGWLEFTVIFLGRLMERLFLQLTEIMQQKITMNNVWQIFYVLSS